MAAGNSGPRQCRERIHNTTAPTRIQVAFFEGTDVDSELPQLPAGCFGVAFACLGVATRLVTELPGRALEELRGRGRLKPPGLHRGSGRATDLADRDRGLFFASLWRAVPGKGYWRRRRIKSRCTSGVLSAFFTQLVASRIRIRSGVVPSPGQRSDEQARAPVGSPSGAG